MLLAHRQAFLLVYWTGNIGVKKIVGGARRKRKYMGTAEFVQDMEHAKEYFSAR